MGNFEKLSVLVIGVIIVMILVVAIHTWTTDPCDPELTGEGAVETAALGAANMDLPSPVGPGAAALSPSEDPWFPDEEGLIVSGETADADAEADAGERVANVAVVDDATEGSSASGVASQERKATVRQSDTLGHISQRMYGTTRYWRKIAEANGNLDPKSLQKGMVLVIPHIPDAGGSASAPSAGASHAARGGPYTVRSGDTIQKIARAAYGNIERWTDIWFENMESISDPERLPVGLQIRLPN